MTRTWEGIRQQEQFGCTISIGLHRGTLYAFRSFLYGRDVWIASQLQSASAKLLESHESGCRLSLWTARRSGPRHLRALRDQCQFRVSLSGTGAIGDCPSRQGSCAIQERNATDERLTKGARQAGALVLNEPMPRKVCGAPTPHWFRIPFPCAYATSSRGPSAAVPPFAVAARPWCLPPRLSPPIGLRSPRCDRYL